MNISKIVTVAAIFIFGLGSGIVVNKYVFAGDVAASNVGATEPSEKKPLYWQAPMDPGFRSDNPGKSPMGMELIPVYADEGANDDGRNLVRINPVVQNNIGVRTAIVGSSDQTPKINTVGTIQIDDDRTSVVDVRTQGWIENMPIKAVGDEIKKGQLLFQLYSRPLVSAQEEYLQAQRMGRDNLVRATRSRLLSLGMHARTIERLTTDGKSIRLMNIYAPQNGIVTVMGAGEGAFVKPGMNILKLVDLKTVWAIADVFEDQVHQVKPGQEVIMHMGGMPGREWKGKVEYVYPTVNAKARTVQVRISFDNKDGLLRPDMFARLTILTDHKNGGAKSIVSIPREALIRTGRSERVILALGDGYYQPAQVVSGQEIGDDIEILSGLSAGEKIVISSQFLLDSEASLRGTLLRLTPENSAEVTDMDGTTSIGLAKGTVISLMKDHGMVTVDHEPIEMLDWPAMIMQFSIDKNLLADIAVGDHVTISVLSTPDENGNYTLSHIEQMQMPETSKNPESDGETKQ
ncbi:MAG: efflux transporter periplasmic adaptor subunit [Robiginitomaculum sp.]|nr:MAG: efflux transporter periplasmic adaptor subunit [Robiginitomaculum sp.]